MRIDDRRRHDRCGTPASPARPRLRIETEDPWNRLVIDLDAIRSNYRRLRARMPAESVLYAVLKSDAYGHGIVEVGKTLDGAGCGHIAVESPKEGIALRNAGFTGEILLMNPIPVWMAELTVRHDLSASVIHPMILEPLNEAAERMGKTCRVHLNVNVGLNRFGLSSASLRRAAGLIRGLDRLVVEGIFGQPRDPGSAQESYRKLLARRDSLRAAGVFPRWTHFVNSSAFLAHPGIADGGGRLGVLLYGVLPPEQARETFRRESLGLRPAMTLQTELVHLLRLPEGSPVGYRSKIRTKRDSLIGTIPLGFSHGLTRNMTKNGYVLVRGRQAPFTGAVSMNSSSLDLTDVPGAQVGDMVTVLGSQGSRRIEINDVAERAETIGADLMTRFGQGLPRYFVHTETDHRPSHDGGESRASRADPEILYIQTERDLPEWLFIHEIAEFLVEHMGDGGIRKESVHSALDYALSSSDPGQGFVLVATLGESLLAVAVCARLDTEGFLPVCVLVHFCVHREHRNRGLGTRMAHEVIRFSDGGVRISLERGSRAVEFFRRLGFRGGLVDLWWRKMTPDGRPASGCVAEEAGAERAGGRVT